MFTRFSSIAAACLVALCAARPIFAELVPTPPMPGTGSMWTNFEILQTDARHPLPENLREIEDVRLSSEQHVVNGRNYRKTSLVLPLPGGDRRERVVLFADEAGSLRMLGYHRILRHAESPNGHTTVFHSGPPSPLTGDPVEVPADTYDYLSLTTAAAEIGRKPISAHLWLGRPPPAEAEIVVDGREQLAVLGAKLDARRVRVKATAGSAAAEALYWFSESPPHVLLQYRGPGGFLLDDVPSAPSVTLRATASSEQVRKVFEH